MSRGATRSRAFLALHPAALAPVVLTCEHASGGLPLRRRLSAREHGVLDSHWGRDLGAWALTSDIAARIGTSAVGGRFSRLWIDLNRRVDDATLVRQEAGGVPLSWNRSAGPVAIERRVLDLHAPYHAEVDRLILRRLVRGIRPLLFSIHSFTPVYEGRVRRFDVGVLFERHAAEARRLGRSLARHGWRVRYNRPYSGLAGMMYAIDRHGSHHGLPCLELEVNDNLFARRGFVERFARQVAEALDEIAG